MWPRLDLVLLKGKKKKEKNLLSCHIFVQILENTVHDPVILYMFPFSGEAVTQRKQELRLIQGNILNEQKAK